MDLSPQAIPRNGKFSSLAGQLHKNQRPNEKKQKMTTLTLTLSVAQIAGISGIILCAYFIRGVTGFGSGLLAVPALALCAFPMKTIVPLVMSLDFIASFILGGSNKRQADWGEIRALLPFGLLGALCGVYALIRFPAGPIVLALSVFTIFFGARNLFGLQTEGHISKIWALPTGLVGSGAGALFGTSSPPYIIYLTGRLPDKTAVRATFSWLFIIDGGFRLVLFATTGLLLHLQTQLAILLGLLPMLAGLYIGNKTHVRISRETMIRLVGALLVISGLMLLKKVF